MYLFFVLIVQIKTCLVLVSNSIISYQPTTTTTTTHPPIHTAVFKILLPTLVFGPVLRSSHSLYKAVFVSNPSSSSSSAIQDLTVPFTYSVLLLSLTSFLFTPLVSLVSRNKHPFVRALMWACLMLGNATTLPVVIMKALCGSLPQFQSSVAQCSSSVTAYSAIFLIPQIIFTWAVVFPYLQCAVMSSNESTITPGETETSSLLPTNTTNITSATAGAQTTTNVRNHEILSATVNRTSLFAKRASFLSFFYKLCNPPVVTIFFAAVLGMVSFFSVLLFFWLSHVNLSLNLS